VVELVLGEDSVPGGAVADVVHWSPAHATSVTEECELLIAMRQDRRQRAEWNDAASPRGRMPKTSSARQFMQRKHRTKRGAASYALRGASVEPVFGQLKSRQRAGQLSIRGLAACKSAWDLQAAPHNLHKLSQDSVRRRAAGSDMAETRADRA
jgi:hypothetical protein